jgi:hypothetical protein
VELTEPPLAPGTLNGATHPLRRGDAKPVSAPGPLPEVAEQYHPPAVHSVPRPVDLLILLAPAKAYGADRATRSYADSRRRPLRRRAASTLRPFFVRILARKPCFFFRRLLFG